jgi:serine/threonine protein kinase
MGELSRQFKGSVAFLAPEILRKIQYDPFKADVWSLGVTLYVCATGHLPWGTKGSEFFAGVAKGLRNTEGLTPDFAEILRMMIIPEPAGRCRLAELLVKVNEKLGEPVRMPRYSSVNAAGRRPKKAPTSLRAAGLDVLGLKETHSDMMLSELSENSGLQASTPSMPIRRLQSVPSSLATVKAE